MGGCSILILLSGLLAVGLAILAVFSVFAAIFVLALVISCIQYLNCENRHRRGKKLGGWIALPIVLFVISIPPLVVILATFLPSFF